MCVPANSKLQVTLSKYYTGREYYVQVQAISTAGEGVWSEPVKYIVPSHRSSSKIGTEEIYFLMLIIHF